MCDSAMTTYLASVQIGATVWVRPQHLQLNEEQFDAAVTRWIS